jgi:hypothetical protein
MGEVAMKARELIAGAAFGPDVLKVITKAFDEAWAELAPQTSIRPQAIDAARLRLANIVLSLATEGSSDVEALRAESIRLFRNQGA